MKKLLLVVAFSGLFILGFILPCAVPRQAFAEDSWKEYRSGDQGFQMLIPSGGKVKTTEGQRGWTELYTKNGDIQLWAVVKKGYKSSIDEMQEYGAEVAGIPPSYWNKVSEETNGNGWESFTAYRCENNGIILYAGLGTGPKGSYAMLLKTSDKEVKKSWYNYENWYKFLKVF